MIPVSSPWTFELEVDKTLRLDERNESEIYICKIRNVLTEEGLTDGRSFEERLKEAAPVIALSTKYFPVKPDSGKISINGYGTKNQKNGI